MHFYLFLGNFLLNMDLISFEILLKNLIFSKNIVRNQIIQITNSRNLSFKDVSSEMTNFESKLTTLGGFLRTSNILYRVLENITIINSFSDLTTIGIKIIDDDQILENYLKNIFECSKQITVKIS